MSSRLRYKIGARLLRPWLVDEMQHWNGLASVYVTREKQFDAMSRRDALVPFINGSARKEHTAPRTAATDTPLLPTTTNSSQSLSVTDKEET